MARAHHFSYLARPNRGEFKKAGNLNYALEHSHGEYIVVFDADFAPTPGSLAHVIPYFADPEVGIMQTAQYFDTGRSSTANWMARYAGTIQDSFFTWVQPHREMIGSALPVLFAAFQTVVLFPLLPPGHGMGNPRGADHAGMVRDRRAASHWAGRPADGQLTGPAPPRAPTGSGSMIQVLEVRNTRVMYRDHGTGGRPGVAFHDLGSWDAISAPQLPRSWNSPVGAPARRQIPCSQNG